MSGFTAAWLRLREPHDATARNRRVLEPLVRWARSRGTIQVLDLGGGTGSNFRFLAPMLGCRQSWTVIDKDAALLAEVPASWPRAGPGPHTTARATTRPCDIARGLGWLERHDADLVTASALLDLVSADWLETVLALCRARQTAIHMTLIHDGLVCFDPPDPDDAAVRVALERHQHGDKGFGPALGPTAAAHTAELLRRFGYVLFEGASPWRLTPADGALQQALIDIWVPALVEAEPAQADRIRAWHARRCARLATGVSSLVVGHRDLTALPSAPPSGP